MNQRAWNVPAASAAFAALVSIALSTQFMFQRELYERWTAAEIAVAWLRSCVALGGVAAAILAIVAVAGRLPLRRPLAKLAWFGAALLVGAFAGEWASLWIQWGKWPTAGLDAIAPRAMRWLPIGAVVAAVLLIRERTSDLTARLHDAEVTRLQLEQQQVEVRLQMLQSQIEPHFLFNTLATVRRLHQTDPPRGRDALSGFIHYLRASLPELRQSEITLGQEVDLIAAYLDVLRVRMGDRLSVVIDVEPQLRSRRVPPLSLATLVENSIKHGISGLPEGGAVSIRAWLDGDRLKLQVTDTGVGLTATGGSGMGLANLRVRLRGLYGERGVLVMSPNEPRGLTATLEVPASDGADGLDDDVA